MDITLLLDCPPGAIRPNDVLNDVVKEFGLDENDFDICSKSFGAWTFKIHDDKKCVYEENKNKIAENIKNSYNVGLIRYAEW